MRSIFISYRRSDSQLSCDRIAEFLSPIFGVRQVFRDLDAIPGGTDFRTSIEQALITCKVMLVVIGPTWLTITDAAGRRRLDDPNDFVRIEIETALKRRIPILPLLVQGAMPPPVQWLTPTIQQVSYQNMRPVRPDPDFFHDMQVVLQDISAVVPIPRQGASGMRVARNTVRRVISLVVALVTFLVFVVALSTWINVPFITDLIQHWLPR